MKCLGRLTHKGKKYHPGDNFFIECANHPKTFIQGQYVFYYTECITNFLPVPSVLILKVSRVICLRFSRPRRHKNVITSNQHLFNSPCGVQGLSATPLTS